LKNSNKKSKKVTKTN